MNQEEETMKKHFYGSAGRAQRQRAYSQVLVEKILESFHEKVVDIQDARLLLKMLKPKAKEETRR